MGGAAGSADVAAADSVATGADRAAEATMAIRGRTLCLVGEFDLTSRDRLVDVATRLAERCITEQRITGQRITGQRITAATTGRPGANAVIDAGDLRFIDAASLGVLVTLHNTLAEAGIRLNTTHPTAILRRVSGICDLDTILGLDPAPAPAPTQSQVPPTSSTAAGSAGPARDRSPMAAPNRELRVLVPRAGARL